MWEFKCSVLFVGMNSEGEVAWEADWFGRLIVCGSCIDGTKKTLNVSFHI